MAKVYIINDTHYINLLVWMKEDNIVNEALVHIKQIFQSYYIR